MSGLASTAAGILRSDRVRFCPALRSDDQGGWTLRDALLVACGCDRHAGPLAYWQWEELHAALRAVRRVIVDCSDVPQDIEVERWANQPSRTVAEVLEALDAVPEQADVPVPDTPTMRPWCDPKVVSTCRIPYVPLAALIDAWDDAERPWSRMMHDYGLEPGMSPWDLLRRVDPVIRQRASRSTVRDEAGVFRKWMATAEAYDPVRWLAAVTGQDPDVKLKALREMAGEAVGGAASR